MVSLVSILYNTPPSTTQVTLTISCSYGGHQAYVVYVCLCSVFLSFCKRVLIQVILGVKPKEVRWDMF
jgi:hypothetical protein